MKTLFDLVFLPKKMSLSQLVQALQLHNTMKVKNRKLTAQCYKEKTRTLRYQLQKCKISCHKTHIQ